MLQWSLVKPMTGILMGISAVAFLFATERMLSGVEPFLSWYYCFAWWSYILFMESLLHRRGGPSALFGDTPEFLMRVPLSVTIWLVFEVFNFRLNNWHYLDIVKDIEWRWLGYALSFATVLPGIFVTEGFLEHVGFARELRCAPLVDPKRFYRGSAVLGGALLLGSVLWPQFLFPCVWLGFIFLLEPFTHRWGGRSLLGHLERGSPRRIVILLAAGLWCGFLWELWNFWAGSKWVYTVPVLGFLKIFEMPILGYLGFPPFALECYVMSNFLLAFLERARKEFQPSRFMLLCAASGCLVVVFWAGAFWGIDRVTVIRLLP